VKLRTLFLQGFLPASLSPLLPGRVIAAAGSTGRAAVAPRGGGLSPRLSPHKPGSGTIIGNRLFVNYFEAVPLVQRHIEAV